ncbi:tetratricopeptide repeat protein [Microbacterium tumbae]
MVPILSNRSTGDTTPYLDWIRDVRLGISDQLSDHLGATLAADAAEVEEIVYYVREAESDADALAILAAYIWAVSGSEIEGIEIFRQAVSMGSTKALPDLGEALSWMGAYEQAVPILRRAIEARSGDRNLLFGLLGQALWRIGVHDADITEFLAAGAEHFDRFGIEYAHGLIRLHRFEEARALLNRLINAEECGAAIMLANLLRDEFDDESSAEVAYRRGVEEGDAFSAYNLALMLRRQGRDDESSIYLRRARRMGDMSEWPYPEDDLGGAGGENTVE